MKLLIFCSSLLFFVACGEAAVDVGEDYGDILASPSALVLTEEEHSGGWGRAECTTCHNLENIHLEDRSGLGIDIAAIHEQTLDEGEAGCSACHGTNGVP